MVVLKASWLLNDAKTYFLPESHYVHFGLYKVSKIEKFSLQSASTSNRTAANIVTQ